MLALMPQSPSHSVHAPLSTMSMSLAILPSPPMSRNQSSASTLLCSSPSPSKKPKLSLNTADTSVSVFGKRSTSLRLDTLSPSSPTRRNTFRNAYSPVNSNYKTTTRRQFLAQPSMCMSPICTSAEAASDPQTCIHTACGASTTSESAIEASPDVLSNGDSGSSRSSTVQLRPKRPSHVLGLTERRSFPMTKKVAFRTPLTEEVKTTRYTFKHSDIESSSSSISTLELSAPQADLKTVDESNPEQDTEATNVESTQSAGKRQSENEEESGSFCPVTPVAGRRKGHRHWVWTLDPIESQENQSGRTKQEANEAVIKA